MAMIRLKHGNPKRGRRELACLFRFEPQYVILFYNLASIAVTASIPERSRPFPTHLIL